MQQDLRSTAFCTGQERVHMGASQHQNWSYTAADSVQLHCQAAAHTRGQQDSESQGSLHGAPALPDSARKQCPKATMRMGN